MIVRSVGIGRTAVGEYIRRAAVIGITWPIPEKLDDTALGCKLFAPAGYNPPRSKPLPEWGHIHAELRRRGVTLALLWEEYQKIAEVANRIAVPYYFRHAGYPPL